MTLWCTLLCSSDALANLQTVFECIRGAGLKQPWNSLPLAPVPDPLTGDLDIGTQDRVNPQLPQPSLQHNGTPVNRLKDSWTLLQTVDQWDV